MKKLVLRSMPVVSFLVVLLFVAVSAFMFIGCGTEKEGSQTGDLTPGGKTDTTQDGGDSTQDANMFTVKFNTQGGSLVADQKVAKNGYATRPSPDPTYSGYTFDGWYTTSSGVVKFDFGNTKITQNRTIFAQWIAEGTEITSGTYNSFSYVKNSSTNKIAIIGYTGSATEVTIPSTINGVTVDEIKSQALCSNTTLISITIPATIKKIGADAFNLAKVEELVFITTSGWKASNGSTTVNIIDLSDGGQGFYSYRQYYTYTWTHS